MGRVRRSFDGAFKAKVALEAVKEEKTLAQISSEYGVHANLIRQWKAKLLENMPKIFTGEIKADDVYQEEREDNLFKEIGKLKVENDYLKKKVGPYLSKKEKDLLS